MIPAAPVARSSGTAKAYRRGTHRIAAPEATWDRIEPLLTEAGITRVADVTRLDGLGIPTFQAVRPGSRNLSVSQGKGSTPMAARVSAAMESLEMWHAEDLEGLPQVRMSWPEMAYDNPIPVEALRWRVPPGRWGSRPLDWVRGIRLRDGARAWIPRAQLELSFLFDGGFAPRPFLLTSSGLASGNCDEEALLHGLCELIERDAVAGIQGGERRAVPLELGVDAPGWLRDIEASMVRGGARIALADATSALGVPVVVADLFVDDLPLLFRGSGCHPEPAVAASRALTEAAQSRLTYISGARDDVHLDTAKWAAVPEPGFVPPPPERSLPDLASFGSQDVATDLALVTGRLVDRGFEPFAVPLRRAAVDLPVWFAFVPGLAEARHG